MSGLHFTQRERDALRAMEGGAPIKVAARQLGISHWTLKDYLSSARAKIKARATVAANDATAQPRNDRMTSLYAIAQEYQQAARTLADLDLPVEAIADTLEGMSGELEVKAQNIAHVVRAIEADAAAVKQWAKDAADRAKSLQARADSLRDYLARNLLACGVQKIEGPGVVLSFRKSSAVVIDEPALIPAEFMRQPEPPPPEPNKTAIADAIKAGREVPGAHVEQRMNLQVK